MSARAALFFAALFFAGQFIPLNCNAQAYKCRNANGKIEISNEGCSGSSRLEQITTSAPVTIDRQRQAAEVNARMHGQLDGIAKENAIDQQQTTRQAQIDAQEMHKRCLDEAMRYREPEQGRMVAACNGKPYQNENVAAHYPPVAQPSQPPLAIIKNCNGANCSDQMGNRYTTTAGKTVRSDGKPCYQRGSAMYCD